MPLATYYKIKPIGVMPAFPGKTCVKLIAHFAISCFYDTFAQVFHMFACVYENTIATHSSCSSNHVGMA